MNNDNNIYIHLSIFCTSVLYVYVIHYFFYRFNSVIFSGGRKEERKIMYKGEKGGVFSMIHCCLLHLYDGVHNITCRNIWFRSAPVITNFFLSTSHKINNFLS